MNFCDACRWVWLLSTVLHVSELLVMNDLFNLLMTINLNKQFGVFHRASHTGIDIKTQWIHYVHHKRLNTPPQI